MYCISKIDLKRIGSKIIKKQRKKVFEFDFKILRRKKISFDFREIFSSSFIVSGLKYRFIMLIVL